MIMKRGSRTLIAALTISLGLATLVTSASQSATNIIDPNQGWAIPDNTTQLGSQNGLFTERSSEDRDYSALLDTTKIRNNQLDPTCQSLDDPNCASAGNFVYYAQIPVCSSSSDINCIESVKATDATGKEFPGSFSRNFPDKAQNQYTGKPSLNLPSGGAGSLFTIPGAEGPAGNTYYVSFIMVGRASTDSSANLQSVHASITPVQLQEDQRFKNMKWCKSPGEVCNTGYNKLETTPGNYIWNESGAGGTNCAEVSFVEGLCAEKEAFPPGFKFSIQVRLSLSPAGWLHGRMTNPEINISKVGAITTLLVSAEPVGVPLVYKHYMWSDLPADLQALYDPTSGKYKGVGGGEGFSNSIIIGSDPSQRAWTTAPSPYSPIAIAELNAWLAHVGNTATVVPSYWSFRSLTQQELQSANKCFVDPSKLTGIVTTDATAYSPGPPAFDKSAGNLNYQVAAPHFVPNGTDTFKGTYDLLMQSSVARCIYGFSNAPIKASVSVISSTGTPQVATTVVSEKNGWLHLSANGFEFSSPTVTVNLQQDQVVVPAPVETTAPAPIQTTAPAPIQQKVVAKQALTCVKGKIVKKFNATKCPAGYKKKVG